MSLKKFQCTRCSQNYVYKTGLTAHIKRKHPLQDAQKRKNQPSRLVPPPRIVNDLISIDTQELENLLQEEQGIYEAANEAEHNIGINESMVNWYDVNFQSSFTNTGEFAGRGGSVLPVSDCEECKVNSLTFEKQRELLMKQDKKLEEFQMKQKASNDEVKHLKLKLSEATKVTEELKSKLGNKDNIVEISIKCNECNFTGRNVKELGEHKRNACSEALIKILTEEGPLDIKDSNCGKCSFQSTNRVLLNEHKERAHKGPIKCTTCGHISPNMESFRKHGKKHMVSFPITQTKFECTPCNKTFTTYDANMDHLSTEHLTEDQRQGAGLWKYNVNNKNSNEERRPPVCRNGAQCRFLRQKRCNFYHSPPPQENHYRQPRQSPSYHWKTVQPRQIHNNQEKQVRQSHQQQAQEHRYWAVPPVLVPWCLHGNKCPLGSYCNLRHESELDFNNLQFQHRT